MFACASLLLGAKSEETPKSLHNVLREMMKVRWAASPHDLELYMVNPLYFPLPAQAFSEEYVFSPRCKPVSR